MGISHSVYVGPYVEYRVKVIQYREDMCKNKTNCPNQDQGFCKECGINLAHRYIERNKERPHVDVYEITDGGFFNINNFAPAKNQQDENGTYRLIQCLPNKNNRDQPHQLFFGRNHPAGSVDLTNCNPKDDIIWLRTIYEKELEELAKQIQFEVKWGVVSYYS